MAALRTCNPDNASAALVSRQILNGARDVGYVSQRRGSFEKHDVVVHFAHRFKRVDRVQDYIDAGRAIARERRRAHKRNSAAGKLCNACDCVAVGTDDNGINKWAIERLLDRPGDERLPNHRTHVLAGKPLRSTASRDDRDYVFIADHREPTCSRGCNRRVHRHRATARTWGTLSFASAPLAVGQRVSACHTLPPALEPATPRD